MGREILSATRMLRSRNSLNFEKRLLYILYGKQGFVDAKCVSGEMNTLEFAKPVGEMIGISDVPEEMLEKVTLDAELGKADVPLVYEPIYRTINDPNLPRTLSPEYDLRTVAKFTSHIEGEEIVFGAVTAEVGPTCNIGTYASGIKYTKEMAEFNETWRVEGINKGLGRGYNAIMNHAHLYPILDYAYGGSNQTAYAGDGDDTETLRIKMTIKDGLIDCATAGRPASILLAPGAKEQQILDALEQMTISGTVYSPISGIDTVIFYDGFSDTVGAEEWEYDGVDSTKAYLVRPAGFLSYVKHDLTIEVGEPDLSKLVEAPIVGWSMFGVFAAVGDNVQELALA